MNYDFRSIEKKWRDNWKKDPYFKVRDVKKNPKKYYCLDMFPYPSGAGLHVGHWKGYVFSDVYARIKWHEGYNVLHPMGWDAFGLPAENYAIKEGIHPKIGTEQNIKIFKEQLAAVGAMYDWDKEVNTTDPNYYKWTQWIFLQMYKAGLAYEDSVAINWCPKCLTGLANEEVVNGECERCNSVVSQRKVRQWMLRITKYAEQLIDGLDDLDWPEKVKLMQKNWIGKSSGARVIFKVNNIELPVFTTRPDTLFGATFMVIAPDHELIKKIVTPEQLKVVNDYQIEVSHMSPLDRTSDQSEKTGIFTGAYATNPVNNKQIPVYASSYVLSTYGTGIIMAVPAHDQRDYDFAKKFNLPIIPVITSNDAVQDNSAYEGDGLLINSSEYNGFDAKTEGAKKIIKMLESKGLGKVETCYRLHDWVFSRQRYWGEPIPLVHCKKCGIVPVPEDQLPIKLPEVESYQPTGTGESPLASIDWWVNTSCPSCGGDAQRETNTMPQWAGSCWYFLRYPDPTISDKPFDQALTDYWMPVDLYVGGIEHAILHLLYSRFYIKVLHDLGYLSFDEPFKKLFNQGMICMYSEIHGRVEKMSKSKGNVVNPDEIIEQFGADALRMYMLFIGPPELDCEWKMDSIRGVKNCLNRIWDYLTQSDTIVDKANDESIKRFHQYLKTYQDRLTVFKVNTAIAALMEYLNDLNRNKLKFTKEMLIDFLTSLSVVVPHFSSELLEKLANKQLKDCTWPVYDPVLAQQEEVEFVIQVNGKLRETIIINKGIFQDDLESRARESVAKWLTGKEIIKIIFVQDRLINFVVR